MDKLTRWLRSAVADVADAADAGGADAIAKRSSENVNPYDVWLGFKPAPYEWSATFGQFITAYVGETLRGMPSVSIRVLQLQH